MDFFIDGRLLLSDSEPPYEVTWNAGPPARHLIEAFAYGPGREEASDSLTVGLSDSESDLMINYSARVERVEVYVRIALYGQYENWNTTIVGRNRDLNISRVDRQRGTDLEMSDHGLFKVDKEFITCINMELSEVGSIVRDELVADHAGIRGIARVQMGVAPVQSFGEVLVRCGPLDVGRVDLGRCRDVILVGTDLGLCEGRCN